MSAIMISEIQIMPIKPQNGLVSFASCVLNYQFYIGSISIYTAPNTALGFRLVFPNKKLASGRIVDCFHPINKEAEQVVSSAIIKKFIELMDNFNNTE